MSPVLKIAYRNLRRNGRRSLLTASLITVGVVFVLVYSALAQSFQAYTIAEITDSMMGHVQVHKKGYVASIDSLPLDKNLNEKQLATLIDRLKGDPLVHSYSERIKLSAMFSNFENTTNIRLNGINPKAELATLPLFTKRVTGNADFESGQILIPDLIAKGMNVQIGDAIVLVANNKQGSVNGINLVVAGIVEQATGPGGRDGYIHIDDARKILRLKTAEANEVVIALKNTKHLAQAAAGLEAFAEASLNPSGQPIYEVHPWTKLSPFYSIVRMMDLMNLSIQLILISIVLISILNVMIMSVYERIREVGTIAAMGTPPSKIVALFLTEGFLLGLFGAALGTAFSAGLIGLLGQTGIAYAFGRSDNLVLYPALGIAEIAVVGVIVVLISVLASLIPALKASRLDPVEALRQN